MARAKERWMHGHRLAESEDRFCLSSSLESSPLDGGGGVEAGGYKKGRGTKKKKAGWARNQRRWAHSMGWSTTTKAEGPTCHRPAHQCTCSRKDTVGSRAIERVAEAEEPLTAAMRPPFLQPLSRRWMAWRMTTALRRARKEAKATGLEELAPNC